MKRLALLACAALLAGCTTDAPTAAPTPAPSATAPTSTSPTAAPTGGEGVTVPLPGAGDVTRAVATDGWPVFVVGRSDGAADVFGAVADVGPDRLGDEVGWCHANRHFEATTPGRRYDDQGRSLSGQGGLVRYAAEVVNGSVVIGERGTTTTGKADATTMPPCARRALLIPDYPAEVPLETAAATAARPVRVAGVLVLRDGFPARLCPTTEPQCVKGQGLAITAPMELERRSRQSVAIARTFWLTVKDGTVDAIASGSIAPPDDDVSEEVQFGYLTKVEGDWVYFDRAEILLGEVAREAAKADGVTLPADGDHYLRNRNPRLRRYRVDPGTQVSIGEFTGKGRAALPALRRRAGKDFSLTLTTRNGALLGAVEELCGE